MPELQGVEIPIQYFNYKKWKKGITMSKTPRPDFVSSEMCSLPGPKYNLKFGSKKLGFKMKDKLLDDNYFEFRTPSPGAYNVRESYLELHNDGGGAIIGTGQRIDINKVSKGTPGPADYHFASSFDKFTKRH